MRTDNIKQNSIRLECDAGDCEEGVTLLVAKADIESCSDPDDAYDAMVDRWLVTSGWEEQPDGEHYFCAYHRQTPLKELVLPPGAMPTAPTAPAPDWLGEGDSIYCPYCGCYNNAEDLGFEAADGNIHDVQCEDCDAWFEVIGRTEKTYQVREREKEDEEEEKK
jgi:hypothetical protein